MRILLDLQACQSPTSRTRGIGRYSLSLALAMVRTAPQHEFWLLLNARYSETVVSLIEQFAEFVPQTRVVTFTPPVSAPEARSGIEWISIAGETVRSAVIDRIAPDAVHVSSLFEGAHDGCVVSVCGNPHPVTAVTLYDLIPLLNPERYLNDPLQRRWYERKLESLARADVLLGISHSATQEGDSISTLAATTKVTISSAVDSSIFFPAAITEDAKERHRALGIEKPFVMYTGGIDWRKNIEGLIDAYAALPRELRSNLQLVLVCHAEVATMKRLLARAKKNGLNRREIVMTGYVNDEDLVFLYRTCELFVFPSLHEGFGLPVLEAMCCGAPVIGSNRSSVPEVIGMADAMFDPSSIDEMSSLIQRALTELDFRESLLSNGRLQIQKFSWEHSARKAVMAIEAAVERRKLQQSSGVRVQEARKHSKLAMISPMPPLRSGIAAYVAKLLTYLTEYYEITVISDTPNGMVWQDISATLPIKNVEWFRENARSFDRVVYQFGNSEFHAHMFDLLLEFPGVVVLHDFYLSGVLSWMQGTGVGTLPFSRAIMHSHGHAGVADMESKDLDAIISAYPCSRFVTDRALGVIVHSRFSMRKADQFYGEGYSSRWEHIPLPRIVPNDRMEARVKARKALGIKDHEFLVCSFGFVAPSKLTDRLLSVWEKSKLSMSPSCKLVLVGQNDPGEYGQAIENSIANMQPQGSALLTGYADRELFQAYLAACDLAVQLRGQSRGETSGAVLDCMAYGVPVVANANGPMAEYPDDVIHKMDDLFDDQQLVSALEKLWVDLSARRQLSVAGSNFVSTHHDPTKVAKQYHAAIERYYTNPPAQGYWDVLARISRTLGPASEAELLACAVMIQSNSHIL